MNKTVIVLRNGFDLSIGLPTSYYSLIESEQFLKEVERRNKLALFLKESASNTSNWYGLETDLLRYTEICGKELPFMASRNCLLRSILSLPCV